MTFVDISVPIRPQMPIYDRNPGVLLKTRNGEPWARDDWALLRRR
jgi:kynurenine formamidase